MIDNLQRLDLKLLYIGLYFLKATHICVRAELLLGCPFLSLKMFFTLAQPVKKQFQLVFEFTSLCYSKLLYPLVILDFQMYKYVFRCQFACTHLILGPPKRYLLLPKRKGQAGDQVVPFLRTIKDPNSDPFLIQCFSTV